MWQLLFLTSVVSRNINAKNKISLVTEMKHLITVLTSVGDIGCSSFPPRENENIEY